MAAASLRAPHALVMKGLQRSPVRVALLSTVRGAPTRLTFNTLGRPVSRVSQSAFVPTMMSRPVCRTLFIATEATPNPDSLKFVPQDQIVLSEEFGTGIDFTRSGDHSGSPLVRRLFKVPGVSNVFLGRDFISVSKESDLEWAALRPMVFAAIMDAYASGKPIVEKVGASDTAAQEGDSEVVAMIKELLETRIRPAVQEDGGDIFFVGFQDGIVKLRMAGSCKSCPSSEDTLKQGVENMLTHYIPEVVGIEKVVDEAEEKSNEEFKTLEDRLAAAGVPKN